MEGKMVAMQHDCLVASGLITAWTGLEHVHFFRNSNAF